jgi:hypothetical protein
VPVTATLPELPLTTSDLIRVPSAPTLPLPVPVAGWQQEHAGGGGRRKPRNLKLKGRKVCSSQLAESTPTLPKKYPPPPPPPYDIAVGQGPAGSSSGTFKELPPGPCQW